MTVYRCRDVKVYFKGVEFEPLNADAVERMTGVYSVEATLETKPETVKAFVQHLRDRAFRYLARLWFARNAVRMVEQCESRGETE